MFRPSPAELEMTVFQSVWKAVCIGTGWTAVAEKVDDDVDMQVAEVMDEFLPGTVREVVSGRVDVVVREDHPSLDRFVEEIQQARGDAAWTSY